MSIFGQNPADITGALFKAKNLADVPDKAAARTALDVPSKAEVQYNSVPVGMILPYWGSVAPVGYVPCSGQTVTSASFPELVTFLGGTTSAVVPDLRGEFLRGWDNGRGVDIGRALSTLQLDMLKAHAHDAGYFNAVNNAQNNSFTRVEAYSPAYASGNTPVSMTATGGGSETRPRNVSVLYCIKAYSSVTNFTSGLNLAGLVNDYSTLSSAAVKYTDFTGTGQNISANGYQKLPGGLIIQWGSVAVASGGEAIVYPLAFPNARFQMSGSPTGTSSSSGAGGPAFSIGTNNGCNIYYYGTSNYTVRWIATGY